VAGDINGFSDIFLATLTPPSSTSYSPATLTTLTRITNSAIAGEEINGHSFFPQISSDGRYIIFCSRARNLVSPAIINLNENSQVFRYDIQTGETILVSKTTAGLPGDSDSYYPRISYTGRYAAYFSFATNIVGSETTRPNFPFIVRYDAVTDTTQQVNLAADGTSSGLGQLNSLGITANGRLITFGDVSNALVPDDTNGQGDIFVKDMENGQIARLSTGPGGVQSNGTSFNPTLTATTLNGQTFAVVFESLATNLTSTATVSGTGDLYSTGFTVAVPQLGSSTQLETPPDVTLNRKRVTITTQKFAVQSSGN
jgi:hypothetical protein